MLHGLRDRVRQVLGLGARQRAESQLDGRELLEAVVVQLPRPAAALDSAASTLRSSACVSTVWAVATAVAALAANASMSRSSSAVKSGPSVTRSKAATMPTTWLRNTAAARAPRLRADPLGEPEPQARRSVAEALGAPRLEDLPPSDPWIGMWSSSRFASTSPAAALITRSGPCTSSIAIARASVVAARAMVISWCRGRIS